MELRTTFKIEPSVSKICYHDPVMFIGSCFASAIGSKMEMGRMKVMINPAGAVYNPVSVASTIDTIISKKEFTIDDLYNHEGTYLSFYHSTYFSSDNPAKVLEKINSKSNEAFRFISSAKFLFITLGTARVYRWKQNGLIVSNCHKIPSVKFDSELLTVNEIVTLWVKQLDKLRANFPDFKVVFTISPVRHWKDGAHDNQVSKSVLFLAVEELLKHSASYGYFPAYELVMDDLRDYRFYDTDMLHPSTTAVEYIWNAFSGCFMEPDTIGIWNEVVKITMAYQHRLLTDSPARIRKFAEKMLDHISLITSKVPAINLSMEKEYFVSLLSKGV